MTRYQQLVRRIRRFLRPPRQLRPTRLGWFFLFVTLGLGLAAINTENNLMYLALGLLLALIAASGLLSEMSLRGLSVGAVHPPDPVEGRPFLFEIVVENGKRRLPSFAVSVEEIAEGGSVIGRAFFFRIDAGERQSRAAEGLCPRFGRLRMRHLRVSTGFPFGLFVKAALLDVRDELIVLPDGEGASSPTPTPRWYEGARPAGKAGNGAELFALRPYREGDTARQIHWRKSATGGGLQSKVYEREERPQAMLALVPGGGLPFEEAVRGAAKWLDEMEQAGYDVGLVAGRRHAPGAGAAHRITLLRELALFAGEAPEQLSGHEFLLSFAASTGGAVGPG